VDEERTEGRGVLSMIHLRRIDATRRMARFYSVAVQLTLFGDWSLQREWGRIGSAGRLVSTEYASESDAVIAMARVLEAKRRRGYSIGVGLKVG
jgi:predicted DNA-binding WGR domain protein